MQGKRHGKFGRYTSLRITDAERKQIERMARETGNSMSAVLRLLVNQGLQVANGEESGAPAFRGAADAAIPVDSIRV